MLLDGPRRRKNAHVRAMPRPFPQDRLFVLKRCLTAPGPGEGHLHPYMARLSHLPSRLGHLQS
eukprot:6642238-Pyramimonas_sp.AAC.1